MKGTFSFWFLPIIKPACVERSIQDLIDLFSGPSGFKKNKKNLEFIRSIYMAGQLYNLANPIKTGY
jgi:hypothetical protein